MWGDVVCSAEGVDVRTCEPGVELRVVRYIVDAVVSVG